ncbi:MAG: hypothetical protein KIT27_00795 [Legionellales bacterium]|nr:hypothetical protein [Legionellales bacterium]
MEWINSVFYYWLNIGAFSQFIFDFLMIASIVLLLVMLVTLLLSQHAKQLSLHQQQTELLQHLQEQSQRQQEAITKLHKRFNLTEMALTDYQQSIANIERSLYKRSAPALQEDKDEQVTYQFAMKLLQSGKSINEVIQYCNLSAGEADVLKALYLKNRKTSTATEV